MGRCCPDRLESRSPANKFASHVLPDLSNFVCFSCIALSSKCRRGLPLDSSGRCRAACSGEYGVGSGARVSLNVRVQDMDIVGHSGGGSSAALVDLASSAERLGLRGQQMVRGVSPCLAPRMAEQKLGRDRLAVWPARSPLLGGAERLTASPPRRPICWDAVHAGFPQRPTDSAREMRVTDVQSLLQNRPNRANFVLRGRASFLSSGCSWVGGTMPSLWGLCGKSGSCIFSSSNTLHK